LVENEIRRASAAIRRKTGYRAGAAIVWPNQRPQIITLVLKCALGVGQCRSAPEMIVAMSRRCLAPIRHARGQVRLAAMQHVVIPTRA